MMPREPGTTLLGRVRFPAALNTATAPTSAATIHRGPPHSRASSDTSSLAVDQTLLHYTVSRASSGTSSPAADQTPLHYTGEHPAQHHRSRPTGRLSTKQPRIQRYIIARGRPNASPLHSCVSSGTSSPVADLTPLHYTAALLSVCSQHC